MKLGKEYGYPGRRGEKVLTGRRKLRIDRTFVLIAAGVCAASMAESSSTQGPGKPVQEPPQAGGAVSAPRKPGGFVPGQNRAAEDPVQVAHGKTLYDVNCRACHGPDLRGGDMGGPNLLRSPVALADKKGELIVPIIHGSRANNGMPPIGISDPDAEAVAAYVRSVMGMIGVQGMPPSQQEVPREKVLVGNAMEGKAFFDVKCASCHSPTGDLQGIGSRITDVKLLQTTWVSGEERKGRRDPSTAPKAKVTVTPASGGTDGGELIHIDDFLVTLKRDDGSIRSYRRDGNDPKVIISDPMEAHRAMLGEYTDKDVHDVTAYLETFK
jgi:cytochrome c oxidase cbb3-type subunit 3